MKKILFSLLFIVFTICLSACDPRWELTKTKTEYLYQKGKTFTLDESNWTAKYEYTRNYLTYLNYNNKMYIRDLIEETQIYCYEGYQYKDNHETKKKEKLLVSNEQIQAYQKEIERFKELVFYILNHDEAINFIKGYYRSPANVIIVYANKDYLREKNIIDDAVDDIELHFTFGRDDKFIIGLTYIDADKNSYSSGIKQYIEYSEEELKDIFLPKNDQEYIEDYDE